MLAVGSLLAALLVLAPERSPESASAGPTVDVTGSWGYVYASGPSTFGECTADRVQAGSSLSATNVECESGGASTAGGGTATGTISGLTVSGQVQFTTPSSFTVNVNGTLAADGSSEGGTWDVKPPGASLSGTYLATRLTETCASPPCSNEAVSVPGAGASVTFDTVTASGGTTVIADDSTSGTLPGQFEVLGQFYHVLTTATFSGNINFCVEYQDKDSDGFVDGTSPPVPETSLQLLHNEGGTFVDRTEASKADYVNNRICAVVSSLSEFVLGSTPPPTPPPPLPTTQTAVGGVSVDPDLRALPAASPAPDVGGTSTPVLAAVASVAGLASSTTAFWLLRRRRARHVG